MASISEIRAQGTELIVTPRPIYEPLNAPEAFKSKLSRFHDNYDLSTSSHLFRFLLAVCGEAGAGSLKRELLYPKLQQGLESTHFYDLDRLYGDPLALPRLSEELYNIDPRNMVMTQAEWQEVLIKDAQYRSRCLIWMRAIIEGGSPRGMALAAEAATGVECDVFERYKYIENTASDDPITIPDIGKTTSVNEFVIIPRTNTLTEAERRRIMKLVDKLRPVNTIFSTDTLSNPRDEQVIRDVAATSNAFYIDRLVTGRSDVDWPAVDLSQGLWIEPGIEKEIPTFAWFSRQESATFLSIAEATASTEHVGPFNAEQRALFPHLKSDNIDFVYDDSYAFAKAFAPVQLTSPWTRTNDDSITLVNQYYPLSYFAENGIAQLPADDPTNFWSSTESFAPVEETLVIDLSTTRPINFIDLEVCYKPIDMEFEFSTNGTTWTPFEFNEEFEEQWQSKFLATSDQPWNYTEHHFMLEQARYVRITFKRREENFPFPDLSEPIEWSVDVRNLRCAHVIIAAEDFLPDAGTDILGNAYRTDLSELPAINVLEQSWVPGGVFLHSGNEINDDIRAVGKEGDGRLLDSSFGVWEATTNMMTNGGFETNATGWNNSGSHTSAISTDHAKFGTKSLKITAAAEAANVLGNYTMTGLVNGTKYTSSMYVWIPTAWTGGLITLSLEGQLVGVTGVTNVDADMSKRDQWQRISTSFTPAADVTGNMFIRHGSASSAAQVIYVDGVQLEAQPLATPYVHTDGGTATRAGGRIQAPASLLNEEQGWVAFRARPGWAAAGTVDPGAGVSPPYSNLFEWTAGGDIIGIYSDHGTSSWRAHSNSASAVDIPQTHAAGETVTVIAAWTETETKISLNGGAFVATPRTYIPSIVTSYFEVGQRGLTTLHHFDGEILWMATGNGDLEDADAGYIHAMLVNASDPTAPIFPGDATSITKFDNTTILVPAHNEELFWQSQPNPVANAVEALYLDLRLDISPGTMAYLDSSDFIGEYTGRDMEDMENYAESGQIVDEIWIDPITFGPNMHIYYSVDDEADNDYKLWVPIARHYILKKGYHSLPAPVHAKYIKLEFSNLTPSPYNGLDYPIQPQITYRKFPSWVQSHFNSIYDDQKVSQGDFNVPYDRVVIDPLSFGFEIQEDRLHSDLATVRAEDFSTNENEVKDFISSITKTAANADVVQTAQESQINYNASFMWQGDLLDDLDRDSALSRYVQNTETEIQAEQTPPVEDEPSIQSVDDLGEERLRKELPLMFFPRKCRHEYQILKTTRPTKVAYFAAVRDVKLYRRDYTSDYDELSYFGSLDDDFHTDVNEFTLAADWGWVVTP